MKHLNFEEDTKYVAIDQINDFKLSSLGGSIGKITHFPRIMFIGGHTFCHKDEIKLI